MQNKWRIIFPVCAQRYEKYRDLQLSLVVIGIETAIGDDDMVHEKETHDFAGFGYLLGKYIIGFAWLRIVAGMIVTEGDNGSVVEHRFFDDEPDVGCRFCNAAF